MIGRADEFFLTKLVVCGAESHVTTKIRDEKDTRIEMTGRNTPH